MTRNYFAPLRTIFQILCLLGVATLFVVVGSGFGQQPGKPDKPGKLPREEEEEPTKTKPKTTLRVDDDTVTSRSGGAIDLRREAEQARHAAVRDLFKNLAVPHDRVSFPSPPRIDHVAPMPDFAEPTSGESLQIEPLDGKKPFTVIRSKVDKVEHYESLALRLVNEFLTPPKEKEAETIPRVEKLQEAEKVLGEVVRFHESARQRGIRKGKIGWDELEKQLRGRLLDVRIEQLDGLIQERKWPAAQDLAEQLAEIYPGQPRFLSALLRLRVQQVEEGLKEDKVDAYIQARRTLDELQRQFTQADQEEPVQRLRSRLRQKAESLLKVVDSLPEPKKQDQLRTVENIWPELPGLQKYLEKSKGYRILNVGVRHLPENLSPATAFVDAEKLGLDLLFESLVRVVPDAVVGQRYEPLLSANGPEQMLLGRQFELVRDAYWYRESAEGVIKEPVLAADVSRTVLAYQKWPARSAEWKDLLGGAQVEGDQHTVRLTLQQGYVDPLALMTFRVLPARFVQKPDDRSFARRPIGSGPYQYAGLVEGRRPFARFLLNPTYGQRAGKTEPAIREIRFFQVREVRSDLANLPLHVVYDLPAKQIEEIRSPEAGLANQIHIVNLKSRRVWFLAVNQRRISLQNEDLRRAIGLAIDRERILDDAFRAKVTTLADGIRTKEASNQPDRTMHRALTGPYPAGSWACKESALLDLHQPADARAIAKAAGLLTKNRVNLKYPSDLHLGIPRACELIKEQVEKQTGIQVVLWPIPWRQLHDDVVNRHDYELAYFCWDHADDRYWLGPLFDPAGTLAGGANFLGVNDPELADLFRRARDRRQFAQLQQITQLIHQHINRKMHLVPLWQLDTCLVLRHEVATTPPANQLDPLRLFGQVEGWKVK